MGQKKIVHYIVLATIVLASGIGLFVATQTNDVFAADCGGYFCETFTFGPYAVNTATGHIVGFYEDFYVEHPWHVTARPADKIHGDPADPADIAAAYLINQWNVMTDIDHNVITGATVAQEWVGITIDEAIALQASGYATTGSSAGFSFKLVKQTVSPEAEAAFGVVSIDNTATGDPILEVNTVEGYCG